MTLSRSFSFAPASAPGSFIRNCRWLVTASVLSLLSACGGGGGGGSGSGNHLFIPSGGSSSSGGWQKGVFKPASDFANKCAVPRTGSSDITGVPFRDVKGTSVDEKNWLRSWSNETYLWYDEIVDVTPEGSDTPQKYFDKLKTFGLTSNGSAKDKYHYYEPTDQVEARYTLGQVYGYGLGLYNASLVPPRVVTVAYVEAGSPAEAAGIARGGKIVKVDNVDLVNDNTQAGVDVINGALFPEQENQVHSIDILYPGDVTATRYSLISANLVEKPVYFTKTLDTPTGKVGYMVFNTHIETAEAQLADAINSFKSQGVTDLVLDLRYNGGGYVYIASELAYMVAGTKSEGKTFDQLTFNNKLGKEDPILFRSVGLSGTTKNVKLPSLELNKVYILSGPNTCSASEAVINGLRGIDVEVILVGKQTCGKPYGFISTDNCGTTYSTINFSGENAKGYGGYSDGFIPRSPDNGKDIIAGCEVDDDFAHALGDISEKKLAAALNYRATGSCGSLAYGLKPPPKPVDNSGIELDLHQINNQILK